MNLKLLTVSALLCAGMNLNGQHLTFTRENGITKSSESVRKTIPFRAVQETGQITLGYCPDEISKDVDPIGVQGQTVSIGAAIRIPASKMAGMVGGKITKIRIGTKSGLTGIYVWIRTSLDGSAAVLQRLGDTADGWNEVTLDTPYDITGEEIYIGYSGKQPSGVMAVLLDGEEDKNATYLSIENSWSDYYGQGWGALCIQAIAQATLPETDLALDDFETDKVFYKPEEPLNFSVTLKNEGTKSISGYSISYRINEGEVVTEDITRALEPGAKTQYSKEISLNSYNEGTYRMKVYLKGLAGGAVDEVALNDTLEGSFSIYVTSYPRKILLEQFTTINCVNCPYGGKVLTAATTGRDDVVWVAHHVGYGTDELTIQQSESYLYYGVSGAPSAMLDRTKIPLATDTNYPPFGIGYPNTTQGAKIVTKYLDYCTTIPAFVSVAVENTYDPQTRQLDIKVTGERNAIFDTFYPNASLSVFLTEDGIIAKTAQSGASKNYVHNHVLRAILTETFGNAIEWEDNKFTFTTATTLTEEWVAAKMKVIAIVNKPFDVKTSNPNDAQVLNVNESVIEDPTYDSITEQQLSSWNLHLENGKLIAEGDYDNLEVYAINGMRLHNKGLTEGLYIVHITTGDQVIRAKVLVR